MTFDELNNLKAVARKYGGLNLGEVDQLIDTAERHLASAEQVRQMREVLGKLEAHRRQYPDSMWENMLKDQQSNPAARYRIGEKYVTHVPAMLFEEIRQALSLTPSEAEQQARENAEKAAKASGLGEHCRELRLALADALEDVFSNIPPKPHDGSCGGPDAQCDQLCADFATASERYRRLFLVKNAAPHVFEQQAAANAEKAALLDWWFDEANEEARETIRCKRMASDSPWTAEQWIDAVRKAAKEAL